MTVEILGAVTPIHMIGESHSLAFNNVLFRHSAFEAPFMCRTRYFLNISTSEYLDGHTLHPDIVSALIADGLMDKDKQPAHLSATASTKDLAGITGAAPAMVFFAGDMDLHVVFKNMGSEFDFILPDDPGYGDDSSKQMVPYATIRDFIGVMLLPFLNAIRGLSEMGFGRVMVHCLPPRTPDSAAAARWSDGPVPAPLRGKLTVLANRLLDDYCTKAGIGFIDTWPELTENLYLKPEFELDGVHLNRKAVPITLDKVVTLLAAVSGNK